MKKIVLSLFLLIPAIFISAQSRVISQSPNEVTFEFTLPEYQIDYLKINGITWQQIVSDEGTILEKEGYPELLFFSENIAIPVDGDISVKVTSVSSTTLKNINLKPIEKLVVQDNKVDYQFYQDTKAYRNNQLYPLEIVQAGKSAFIGDRRFVPLHIFPFQYRATTKELIVNSKFKVEVRILGNKSASPNWQLSENPIDQVGDSFFLNNASSKSWRLAKTKDNSYQSPKGGTSSVNEIQIIVNQEGIYKVTYQQLKDFIQIMTDSLEVAMAWDIDTIDPRHLELTDEKGPVPIHFFGEADGHFNREDYFEFFGDRHYGDTCYNDDYTAENVYTLYLKSGLGARMAVENGGLVNSNPAQYIVPDAYEQTVHFEQQLLMDKLGHSWSDDNPDFYKEDIWFWRRIKAPDLDIIPFQLQYPKDSVIRRARAKVSLYGLTYSTSLAPGQYDHNATVRINQAMINTHNWIGQTEQIFENDVPFANSYLYHGTNNMYISLSGNTASGTLEQVLLDYLELTYWREYKTSEDKIKFTKPSDRPAGLYQFEISGFNSNDVSVYKIGSSIFNSLQIEPFAVNGGAPWTVSLQDSVYSTDVVYYAVTESKKLSPLGFRLNLPSDLKNPANAANVIMVGNRELLESEGADLLVNIWEADSYIVRKVDYQDIFDEFNHGIRSAESLKEFFTYAYNNWSPPQLNYVVLLGEGINDERDNSPSRQYALVPVKKVWTINHGATASDTWYGTIVGNDPIPDIVITRINAWNPEQVLAYAQKAYNYRNNLLTNRLWNNHITLSAGGTPGSAQNIFALQSERIRRKSISQDYRVTRVYGSSQGVNSDYYGSSPQLKEAINTGTQYLQFMGHGGSGIWADYNLLNLSDIATLNNQTYPIVVSLACYCSAFDTNGLGSISEAFTMQPNKGAIATFGFTGLSYERSDEDWALALTEAIYKHDFPTLGQAYQYTLAKFTSNSGILGITYALTYGATLLGDPLIRLKKPITDISVNTDEAILMPGDTLVVRAQFPQDVLAARLYIQNNDEIILNIPYDLPVINGNYSANYIIPANIPPPYTRKIFLAGYSATDEYIGRSVFGVGRSALTHIKTIPENPAWNDSLSFIAKLFSNEELLSLKATVCVDSTFAGATWLDLPMQAYPDIENGYITINKLPPLSPGKEYFFKYIMTTNSGNYESVLYSYLTRLPDLYLKDIKLETSNSEQILKVLVQNIGNAASLITDIKLYTQIPNSTETLVKTLDMPPLAVNEEIWVNFSLDDLPQANIGTITLKVKVNVSGAFPESHSNYNASNVISLTTCFNYYTVTNTGSLIQSVDNNVTCEIPPNLVPSGRNSVFYINSVGTYTANAQPDIYPIKLKSYDNSPSIPASNAYEIRTLDTALVDSTGTFINNKKIKLTFFYSTNDQETQNLETENSYKIYRWEDSGKKWILQGGNISASEDKVNFEVSKPGIYTIYRNCDRIRPSIDINVQEQEFTVGGYISGTGTMSLLLSDANGIDVFDNSIQLYLNGNKVPEEDYTVTINSDDLNRIPIKYQLNLSKGTYSLVIDCQDVNGNFNTRETQFFVNNTFDIKNIGNYPNPVLGVTEDPKNQGRTRFTYVLTDDADEVTIKVYTVAGRLVKTFKNLPTGVGYHEYPRTVYGWDCKDEFGYYLANGVYFYKVIAKKGNKKIEKTMKMAILK
ncbi:MAG TPA: C25 family cysteine peptidase [Candidatus Syntrophosphaera sp.]|mgnify:FL=1|nr:C25 family cysteine peptidase [Candidatus Syntrophosphaera sp.]